MPIATMILEAPVGHKPYQRDADVDAERDQRLEEGEHDGGEIQAHRDPAFEITAERAREERIALVRPEQHPGQDVVGDSAHQEDDAIGGNGHRRKVVLVHPVSGERNERKPEKQVHVRP